MTRTKEIIFCCLCPVDVDVKLNFNILKGANRWFACDVMEAMLVYRNNKIFLQSELTSIFMQTNFLLFCTPTWRQCNPPILSSAVISYFFN